MERFYEGDDEAFGELHERCYARLVARAVNRLPSRLPARKELAEDLVGDAFAKAMRTRTRPAGRWRRGKGDVGTWLAGIVQKQVVSFLRSRRGRESVTTDISALDEAGEPMRLESQAPGNVAEPAALFAAAEERRRLASAISQLPANTQAVLKMKYWRELRYREISVELGVSAPTISRRIHEAQQTLRIQLADPSLRLDRTPELFA